MRFALRIVAVALIISVAPSAYAQSPRSATIEKSDAPDTVRRAPRALPIAVKPWTGDLDKLLERRMIRVAAPYGRTLFFNDRGRERGLSAEFVRDFEAYLNKKYKKKLGKRPLTIYIIATTRDKLLPDVAGGLYDIAVGNLTITDERLKSVDMVPLTEDKEVHEVLVTGPKSPAIKTIEDLSGQTVHVRRSSSYYESLVALNERFRAAGKPEAKLVLVPDSLENEDMMEMVNTGILQTIVVDDWLAKLWAQILPNISVHEDVVLREDAKIGWAIRKDSPLLVEELKKFYAQSRKQGIIAYRIQQYAKRMKQIKDPTQSEEWKRFQSTVALFEKYGRQYAFDPLMLTAQGFQESQLNQSAKSNVGAVGVMQLMPATGASMKVGDINNIESNIHAGAKYLDTLMTKYFTDAKFGEAERTLFAFAAYNAGPGNISSARKAAVKRGLDPNAWFNSVEIVVAQRIGMETTTYVRNIYKYYVAYKLVTDAQKQAAAARESVAAPLK